MLLGPAAVAGGIHVVAGQMGGGAIQAGLDVRPQFPGVPAVEGTRAEAASAERITRQALVIVSNSGIATGRTSAPRRAKVSALARTRARTTGSATS